MSAPRVTVLSGGVGGARFAEGLARVLDARGAAESLAIVVNTGDDFVHWGLHVSPDVDTVAYWLAGAADTERGWGLADETFAALGAVERLGGPSWFQLGDRDLAMHILRTEALRRGDTLTAVTARLATALGVAPRILPMSDAPVATVIETDDGALPFQEWFVARRAAPVVRGVRFEGEMRATAEVLAAIEAADVAIIAPSNPYVSIDPILALGGVRDALARKPVVAVSPIVAGRAVKGPLAGMIESLAGVAPSAAAIARHYRGLADAVVVERGDEAGLELPSLSAATIMRDAADRERLAAEVLGFAEEVAR